MRATVEIPGHAPVVFDDEILVPHEESLLRLRDEPLPRLALAAPRIVLRSPHGTTPAEAPRGDPRGSILRQLDLETMAAQRRRLDDLGFGIAEAMDTAQRFVLGGEGARLLAREAATLGLANLFMVGAGEDFAGPVTNRTELVDSILAWDEFIRALGGIPIVLPSLWLARSGATESEYVSIYSTIIERARGPLALHWLGGAFAPALARYFPGESFRRIMAVDPAKVFGCKISLLDPVLETKLRRSLARNGQIVLTGDDHAFGQLLLGESPTAPPRGRLRVGGRSYPLGPHSHALLGVLDAAAEPVALALRALVVGDVDRSRALLAPCEAFGRHVFSAPVTAYRAGLAFCSYLAGRQSNLFLANGAESDRDLAHQLETARLASAAGLIPDAAQAASRLQRHIGAD